LHHFECLELRKERKYYAKQNKHINLSTLCSEKKIEHKNVKPNLP
jgi:hypothetical protein